ncbi:MAG TPA: phosphatase PAP2/dual specificity phosphatase family protein [Bryobacteraceae bacterium]|nr:phosphatase PAP2/dual specificity phosphatase family protein [Bryobacteraceae bacterium]
MAASVAAGTEDLIEQPSWPLAALWLAGLAPFFFLTYGLANWVTSLRPEVPSLVFGWEHHVPFVPWTIVPYWSLDLFYAASLFICRTRTELNIHAKRLLTAQIVSVAVFFAFPLRFTFERPHPAGLLGWMFDALTSFDQPFNQAPSLHVSVATILWARYSHYLRDWPLWLVRFWLILAAVSTMTTYQHHFIDVATGLWLGMFCIAFISDHHPIAQRPTFRDASRKKTALIYLAGFVALVALAIAIGGWASWLLWPAGSLVIVAGIYFAGQPELFQKRDGAIAPSMTCLLAPYLAAAWLNSRLWTRLDREADEIADGVWIGRLPRSSERDAFASIVDLAAELPVDAVGVSYRIVPMLDLVAPTFVQLDAAVKAIEELAWKRPTLVCCALGYSRSACAVAAWLTASGRASSVNDSIALVEARRPSVVLRRAQRELLEEWCNAHVPCAQ